MSGPLAQVGDNERAQRTLWIAGAITFLALVLRVAYLWGADVRAPVVGDIREYFQYAWNLANHHVFSSALASRAPPSPDSWRGPGYPAFLAMCMSLTDHGGPATVKLAQWLQVLLSTLLVPLSIALARRFLPPVQALLVGLLVAVWPHLVVFASTLLSETLFAFALLLALLVLDVARARGHLALGAASGVLAGLAWLVNPILLFLPPLLALLLYWRGQRRLAACYLLGFVLVFGGWTLRNASLPPGHGSAERIEVNFVQGSWPLYHAAYNDRFSNAIAKAYFDRIEDEIRQVQADPRRGLRTVEDRLRADPAGSLRWYLLQKPWLLWDWSVRIGWGDVYFVATQRSPFERMTVFRAIHAVCKAINPLLFAFALLACVMAVARSFRRKCAPPREPGTVAFAWQASAILMLYLTAVHAVLQAEPRYSVAYRPFEFLLAVAALSALLERFRPRRARTVP